MYYKCGGMKLFIKCLAVGIGGFLGSVLRYLLSEIPVKQINYPVNTLITNIIGAVIIGMVISYADKTGMRPEKLLLLKTGFCGGLTTFSTFSYEAFSLIDKGEFLSAGSYIFLSIACSIAGVYLGLRMV